MGFPLTGNSALENFSVIGYNLVAYPAANIIACIIKILVSSVLSFIVMLFTEKPTWESVTDAWLPLCYAGILSMGVAYSLQIVGQKFLKPTPASLIMSLESVFAVVFGCLILKETLTVWETIGCVLVFIAVILSQLPDKRATAVK